MRASKDVDCRYPSTTTFRLETQFRRLHLTAHHSYHLSWPHVLGGATTKLTSDRPNSPLEPRPTICSTQRIVFPAQLSWATRSPLSPLTHQLCRYRASDYSSTPHTRQARTPPPFQPKYPLRRRPPRSHDGRHSIAWRLILPRRCSKLVKRTHAIASLSRMPSRRRRDCW